MALSASFRLLLAILTSAMPFESLLLRPACCCAVAFQDQSQSSCCSESQVGKAVSPCALEVSDFRGRNNCCQSKLAVDRNPIAEIFNRGSEPNSEFADFPLASCLSDGCSCGCQQAPEADDDLAFVQIRDSEQLKTVALSGMSLFVVVQPMNIDSYNMHRRVFRPIVLSSVERCARFCCWLI